MMIWDKQTSQNKKIRGKNNARSSLTKFIFLIYNTMTNVNFTLDDKIQAVQELVDTLWKSTKVTEENYLRQFWIVLNAMIEELWFDKTKKGDQVANDRFAQFIHFEFLPQYSKILWFDLKAYQQDAKNKINGNLSL